MSVLSCVLLWSGRRGKDGIERIREYTSRYEVLTDDDEDDITVAAGPEAAALGMPRNGDPYENDPDAVMIEISGECSDDDPRIWYVECQYSSRTPPELGAESQTIDTVTGDSIPTDTAPGEGQIAAASQRDPNPVNWTATYKITHEQTTEPLTHDYLGDPIVNSAGDPFFPPLTIERSYAVITVTKNYLQAKFDYLETFVDTVNLNIWNGRKERTCRIIALEYEPVQGNGFSYWRYTFRIKYKPGEWDGGLTNDVGQGWDLRLLDVGFRTRAVVVASDPVQYTWTDIEDAKTGEKPDKPVMLNGAGIKHPSLSGATLEPPKFVTWEVYKRRDWAGLGL